MERRQTILPYIVLSVVSLYSFVWLSKTVIPAPLSPFDTVISEYIYGIRNPFLTYVMVGISHAGGELLPYFAAITLLLFLIAGRYKYAVLLALMLIAGFTFSLVLKDHFGRLRPLADPLIAISSLGYPSAHAVGSFIFYGFLCYITSRLTARISCGALIVLVGISRVYLGVHYPTDVLAGYLLGFWIMVTVILLDKTVRTNV